MFVNISPLARYRNEKMSNNLPFSYNAFAERGSLEPGYFADVVVFDPDKLEDRGTFSEPCQYSRDIEYLLVNEVLIVSGGEYTGDRGGIFIRRD